MNSISKIVFIVALTLTSLVHGKTKKSLSYEDSHPLRFEVCALTNLVNNPPRPQFDWGHIVLYMTGVCRKIDGNKPTLESCFDNRDGVTVSVNSRSKNVNWLAIPGKQLSFFGNLKPNEPITADSVLKIKDTLKKLDVYRGIDIHSEKPSDEDDEAKKEILASASMTMEAGITFARNLNCIKVPVTRAQVSDAVEYLNSLNDQYFQTRDFNWSPFFNNCAHLVHNTLARINVWGYKQVDRPWYGLVGHAAVPGNEPWDLANLVYQTNLSDPVGIFKNEYFRKSLQDYGVLPVRHGILMEQISMNSRNNVLYSAKGAKFHTLQLPESKINYTKYIALSEKNLDMKDNTANLRFFKKKYIESLKQKKSIDDYLGELKPEDHAEFQAFYNTYYIYLASQLARVNQELATYEK